MSFSLEVYKQTQVLPYKRILLINKIGMTYRHMQQLEQISNAFYYMKETRLKSALLGASLVAQWLRICLPMQGTRVRALVWEDSTCCGATGPMSHNY